MRLRLSYKKKYEEKNFCILKVSEESSGSEVPVPYRSANPDPHQNVKDPLHWQKSEKKFRFVCRTIYFYPTWTRSPAATSSLLPSSSSTSHSSVSVAVAAAPAVVVAPRQQRLTPLTPPDAAACNSDSPPAADEASAWPLIPAAPGIGIRGLLWCSSRLGNPPPPDSMEGPPPSPPPPPEDSMEGRREKPAGEGVRGERGGVTRSSGGQRVDIMVRLLGCRSCTINQPSGWDLAEWLERLAAKDVVETALGSNPASSSDTMDYEGAADEKVKKNTKKIPL